MLADTRLIEPKTEDDDHQWKLVKENVLTIHEKADSTFDTLQAILGKQYTALVLNKIMKKVQNMSESPIHRAAFRLVSLFFGNPKIRIKGTLDH